jgi:hypothetical protein
MSHLNHNQTTRPALPIPGVPVDGDVVVYRDSDSDWVLEPKGITTSTSTDLTGFITGDGTDVGVKANIPTGDVVGTSDSQTLTNKTLQGAFISLESEYDNGNSGTSDTINWNNGNIQKSTLTGNVTYTFTDPTGTTDGRFSIRLVQDGTGGRTVTWPASVKWPEGTAPTISTAASAEDIITFEKRGSSYYGVASQNFS